MSDLYKHFFLKIYTYVYFDARNSGANTRKKKQ